jgi:hypothetical protein
VSLVYPFTKDHNRQLLITELTEIGFIADGPFLPLLHFIQSLICHIDSLENTDPEDTKSTGMATTAASFIKALKTDTVINGDGPVTKGVSIQDAFTEWSTRVMRMYPKDGAKLIRGTKQFYNIFAQEEMPPVDSIESYIQFRTGEAGALYVD